MYLEYLTQCLGHSKCLINASINKRKLKAPNQDKNPTSRDIVKKNTKKQKPLRWRNSTFFALLTDIV